MNESDFQKCFYSKDGVSSEGPILFSKLKELHAKGELKNNVLCSIQDSYGAYEFWRPVSRYNLTRQDFDSRSCKTSGVADLLSIYSGWFIALNLRNPKELDVVQLVRTEREFFSVSERGGEDMFHYPYTQIISLAESIIDIECKIQKPVDHTLKQGALSKFFKGDPQDSPPDWGKARIEVPLLVEVNHLVVYKGSSGAAIGVSVPIG